jgi:probable F420-dependent oxidoreductase
MKVDSSVGYGFAESSKFALEAEEFGYDGVFTAEVKHDPFIPLAMSAAQTSKIQLGTSIAVAFARTPMTLAYIANDLQIASQGRFIMGLGTQIKAHITRRFDMPWSHPAPRLAEMVQAIQAIWTAWETGDKLDFRGEYYNNTLMTPMFTPDPHEFGRPKIFAAAVGAVMTETVANVCDGLMPHGFSTEQYFREVTLPAVERGLAKSGRSRDDFEINAPGFVVTGATEEAFTKSKETVRKQISFYGSTPAYKPVFDVHGWGSLGEQLHRLSVSDDPNKWDVMATLIDDDVLHTFAVVAEPDKLAASILERYGNVVDRIHLGHIPGTSDEDMHKILAELQAADRKTLAS